MRAGRAERSGADRDRVALDHAVAQGLERRRALQAAEHARGTAPVAPAGAGDGEHREARGALEDRAAEVRRRHALIESLEELLAPGPRQALRMALEQLGVLGEVLARERPVR